MTRIRRIEIENFRSIRSLVWHPSTGINCLIGPGDSGKSSILDAIDYCIGDSRSIGFSDADFHKLDYEKPFKISITVGELSQELKSLETYGSFLRGFDCQNLQLCDEPNKDSELVLTIEMKVGSDLEPEWSLFSERAELEDQVRSMSRNHRVGLAPTRIGEKAESHLTWQRGSVLNHMFNKRANFSESLVKTMRNAREGFSVDIQGPLADTLQRVAQTGRKLGVFSEDQEVSAMLDALSLQINGRHISLHDRENIPLRRLGLGSTRLLAAGLQRDSGDHSSIVLVDELEYGLEPHRVIRFLHTLGAKDPEPPLQVFMTTHSPIPIRELSGSQLFVLRPEKDRHQICKVGTEDNIQGTVRLFPEAFLAKSVIVGEGATEVGFIRGLDQFRRDCCNCESIHALGTTLVEGGGNSNSLKRALALQSLGFKTAVLLDNDTEPGESESYKRQCFVDKGGILFTWSDGQAIEDALFMNLPYEGIAGLIRCAYEFRGKSQILQNIESASGNQIDRERLRSEDREKCFSEPTRQLLGKASKSKNNSWFKTVSHMEQAARCVVGPNLAESNDELTELVESLFTWCQN